ncbi:MAG: PrsW family intramembrane metalloprotease [Betaproteobacteria bacterium]|nr:PrsW family intramembrane metalloprotease [Betaproteobacteria bacterium]
MAAGILIHTVVGLAPVLCFLASLLYLDSYKLVSMRSVVAVVACGLAVAGGCYFVNGLLLGWSGVELGDYARYAGPVVEELGKALVVVALIRTHRIGFLVDAAIYGFAVGAGFAVLENVWYQFVVPDAGLGLWIVRGFGTAIMHGGTTAILAVTGLALLEQRERSDAAALLPGYLLAVVLHAAYNQLVASPRAATLAVLLVLPALLFWVFRRSERSTADWLGQGFDADAAMLEAFNSGSFADSPAGRYLQSLKRRFRGPIVADLLCYLRLHTELALRAKGILMMRESGFDSPLDDQTRAKFDEVRYLEKSMGKTGLLAVRPLLRMSRKEMWQLCMLGSQ